MLYVGWDWMGWMVNLGHRSSKSPSRGINNLAVKMRMTLAVYKANSGKVGPAVELWPNLHWISHINISFGIVEIFFSSDSLLRLLIKQNFVGLTFLSS